MSIRIPVCACGEKNIDQCMCSCDGVPRDVRELCNSASGILEVHSISIPLPWDGTLDDLEKDRFRGLLAVVNFVREEERKRCAKIAEDQKDEWQQATWNGYRNVDYANGRGHGAAVISAHIRGEP